jgi:NAD(P)-dependent dehydrogenase (short-subunit alcohol dehydrogenase family)
MAPRNRTALITGTNSGLGFEASTQLAEAGFYTVIITARTEAKERNPRSVTWGF